MTYGLHYIFIGQCSCGVVILKCGWCQNDQGHLVKVPRPRPYPASRTVGLSFINSPGLNHTAVVGWGGRVWTPGTPFHLSLESLDPIKQHPETGRSSLSG